MIKEGILQSFKAFDILLEFNENFSLVYVDVIKIQNSVLTSL